MKHISPLALLGLLTLSLAAQGQDKNNDHAGHHPAPASSAAATVNPVNPATPITPNSALSEGEVRKVDLAAKKIILKHGEIKNLDMGAMTMVFQVNDPALLDKVKAGDKVRFRAEQIKGAFVVTSMEKVMP